MLAYLIIGELITLWVLLTARDLLTPLLMFRDPVVLAYLAAVLMVLLWPLIIADELLVRLRMLAKHD